MPDPASRPFASLLFLRLSDVLWRGFELIRPAWYRLDVLAPERAHAISVRWLGWWGRWL